MAPSQTSLTHWGAFTATVRAGDIASVRPWAGDADPSPALANLPGSVRHRSRITTPAVRRGWLDDGPGPTTRRGADEFVAVTWDELVSLLGDELRRVAHDHGNEAIYGGSYGWSSAGRLHHAQSQVHRFLNCIGGYTYSRHSYSLGATGVIMPRVVGTHDDLFKRSTQWDVIVENTDLLVCFGGLALKNTAVNDGGTTAHPARHALNRFRDRGGRIVSFSPLRDDVEGPCDWYAPVPGTDVAIMLALAHVLATEDLADRRFLATYCTGYDRFERYLLGLDDGTPKSPQWAASLCGLTAEELTALARRMAAGRTLVTVSWSLQRTRHGEQAPWMAMTLAAMLGQIGLPGGGFGHGYGSMNEAGLAPIRCALPRLPQGINPVSTFIPVAAVSDMLLHPGEPFDYNGLRLTYPDIRLVYWAGGNPFHHHQNLPRLRRALCRPDTVVVHDPYWTAMAKHADIVVPSTTFAERDDLSGSRNDPLLMAMPRLTEPYAQARDDYDTFTALARHLGVEDVFTEGRTSWQWLRHIYEKWMATLDFEVPTFDEFWAAGQVRLPTDDGLTLLADFRADPAAHRLATPSGKIEIFSAEIDGFGYDDCRGHPRWFEPTEWLGGRRAADYPLHLVANQPANRLHSQLDGGAASQSSKVAGREPIRMNPHDAHERGVTAGDVVRVYNDRGACLAGVVLDDGVRRRVVQLSTGAWFDPADPADLDSMCVHGNPNVLTDDVGTSSLAHGCTGAHVLVQVEKYTAEPPAVRAHQPPVLAPR
ncbi:molybdopterin guanine dinucleotide-containing S/N-oxide reductase [Mycolicibacterium parafortuitum]|uniref:Trimethylamine-N-oxide reductase (Cytochrome c)/ dimethyl sulfoxide reductase [Rhodococcus jostii RHA1] n=1 Tax=Mycolicibacterium parafortuitum TaxID=39692 RepID=A0A375YK47_MYCPF|nr:molybdopterin guanine dinucleotide-containing S/N-oxide reductase [Mycolicibacterium parafortuitum]ORB25257.1 molybdopterin oxidoreductase [Mycolicibacterium parafortuitum]SRX81516.1 trimethylamine-N-oxide reductase (cytochrome c)/ dimethyl sulfoxide reductase [Rhodococcus jostii RHA1] [Mycolicibacterium parafortuitum]